MTFSTTKSKLKSVLKVILPLIFWLIIYELIALIINNSYFFPRTNLVFSALFAIKLTTFFKVCAMTMMRIILALLLGVIIGLALGVLSARFNAVYHLLNPFMTAVKATPVASLIIVLWIMLSGNMLPIIIALFMVMPIIWQSTYDAFYAVDRKLLEVADVFELSHKYRFMILYLPSIKKYLIPSLITSVGLAWKSEIATEIIAYTRNSIGQLINDGKYNLDTPTVFAWTFIVIVFSIVFETVTRMLLGRIKE